MSQHKTKREAVEDVKMRMDTYQGQTVIVKVYPESGKRDKQKIKCKG